MLARRLTAQGIEQFDEFLLGLRDDPRRDAPLHLLTGAESSAAIDAEVDAEPRVFHSRLEIAEHLSKMLRVDSSALRRDKGFWSWLGLAWFESICPIQEGRWQPGERYRWIAELEDPRKSCRHLLAGPYQIYRAHRDDPARALSLLSGPVYKTGPLVSLLASRPSLVTCRAVVGVATRLYYDQQHGRNRAGLGGRGPGSPRRFVDLLSQLDLTWDLHSLTTEELLELLPAEFDEFHRSQNSRQPGLFD